MAGPVQMVARQVPYYRTVFLRTFKGNVVSNFFEPLFNVAAMGILLGGFVRADPATLEGAPSYLAFVVPGLLAAQAMTTGVIEATWPVMGALKWDRTYWAMQASPLRVVDIVNGHLAFLTFRLCLTSAVFLLAMLPFGVIGSVPGGVGAFCVGVLVGVACATPVYAFSVGLKSESAFGLVFRLGVVPLFLFSGAFFPLSNLSPTLQWLAKALPLWHGVDLARMLTLGTWQTAPAVGHLVYLLVLAAVGYTVAVRRLTRRMAEG